jgi:fibronectin-binding autotransporter adhesin
MNRVRQQEKCPRRFVLFLAAMIVLVLAEATPALAQCTDSWTGAGGDNNWSNGANWSTGSVPGSSDAVCIQNSGAAVLLDVADGVADLAVGSSDSLTFPAVTNTNNGLSISGSSITNAGQIIMAAPVSFGTTGLNLSSSGTVILSGRGTITLQANSFGGDSIGGSAILLNRSTIQGGGGFDMTFNNASAGVINANESGVQLVVGRNQNQGASTNTGLMEATDGGQLAMGSLTLNNVGGTIKASGKNSYVQLEGEGQGNETFTGGTWTTANGGVIQVVDGSALLDGTNGNTITNSGTMQLVDGAAHPGGNFQGVLMNKGTLQILSKGNGVGLNIPGGQTFTLTGAGSLTMGDGTDNAYNNQDYISGSSFVNQQLIQGTGGIENLTSFNNSGTINANVPTGTNNLQLQLGRAGASTNTGIIEATNGGVLVVGSTTINNTGGTIESVGANSNVSLVGSLGTSGLTISGGTYTTSGGGVIYGYGGTTFDGTTNPVTNSGTLIVPSVGNPPNINAQGALKNTGTIQLLPNASGAQIFLQLVGGENLTLAGSGTLIMGDGTNNAYNNQPVIGDDFGGGGIFTNQSTIEGTGTIASGTLGLVNGGTINANVPVGANSLLLNVCCEGTSGIVNNGTMEASKGGMLQIYPYNSFNNTGTLNAASKSTIYFNNNGGPFLNLVNGTLTGGTYNVAGTLQIPGNITTNDAKIALIGKASQILNPNTNALTGLVTNAAKGSFDLKGGQSFASAGTFTNQGAISIGKGSTFTVGEGGSYVQHGGKTTVNGKLTLSSTEERTDESDPAAADIKIVKGSLFGNGGTIAAHVSSSGIVIPADSLTATGKLGITGAYTQTAAGALDANLAGADSGQFNVLAVTGTATLGGTLNIGLLKNFVPLIGAEFEILTAKHVSGTFATVNGIKINSSEHFTVTYNSENVTLTVVSGD